MSKNVTDILTESPSAVVRVILRVGHYIFCMAYNELFYSSNSLTAYICNNRFKFKKRKIKDYRIFNPLLVC